MPLDTPACNQSEGIIFIGKDCAARNFIIRMNKVSESFCRINDRIERAIGQLDRFCPYESSSSLPSSSSSSSFKCDLGCETPPEPDRTVFLRASEITEDAYASIELLEEETCNSFRLLLNLEKEIETGCYSSSSSLPPSSSSSPPSSSSSPSLEPSSSDSLPPSSSSSSTTTNCPPRNLQVLSYCPVGPKITTSLQPEVNLNPLYGFCMWVTEATIIPIPSSSSSPSESLSSSSSSSYDTTMLLRYNLALQRWEITTTKHGLLAYRITTSETNPLGVYQYAYPGCASSTLIIA